MSAATWSPSIPVHSAPGSRRPSLVSVPTGAGVSATVRRGGLRITRAGRLAITVGVLSVALLAGAMAAGWGGGGGRMVTVQPGQSLFEIAQREMPGADVRTAVTQIQLANDLASAQVTAGRRLSIPGRG